MLFGEPPERRPDIAPESPVNVRVDQQLDEIIPRTFS